MEECHSRQLRPKTMLSYEHTLKLFSFWLTGRKKISKIEDIKEKHIREYIIELQTRGKYTVRPSGYEQNLPENRKDYEKPMSSIPINNYLRNMKTFFSSSQETEIIFSTAMGRIKVLPEEGRIREYLEVCRPNHSSRPTILPEFQRRHFFMHAESAYKIIHIPVAGVIRHHGDGQVCAQ